ncbi:MAG: hypothetical protein IV086_02755 [Hyphomonadaceae bacterium]|nr:MAG: hypothetical protein FD160_2656 [Caulobacteraceae bacterium]MBT9444602.1 hypothetical protein [Hyphomonadaceae bacterium]TPW04515.1 MAG: hypothetical protein FD124_2588 [Alphaproteobacteria bacterium]
MTGHDQLKQMTHEAGDAFDDVVRSVKKMTAHLGEDSGDAISKSASALVHAAAELAEQAKQQSVTIAKKAGEEVREHPAATAAIVAAAVALLGFALTHRKGKGA